MASKLIINNNLNTELQITHKDNEPAKQLDTGDFKYIRSTVNELVSIIPTGATLSDYAGQVCFIKDLDRGGSFIYDSTKVADSNDGTNFSGWIRQYDGAVNVKWFGAKGDGVADDTLAIQKALTTLPIIKESAIYIPSGVYNISDTLVLPNIYGFKLYGDGATTNGMSTGTRIAPVAMLTKAAMIDDTTIDHYTVYNISDLAIIGDCKNAISITHTTLFTYTTTFRNLFLKANGGSAFVLDNAFSTSLYNVVASSEAGNSFEITRSGPSFSMYSCYAQDTGVGYAGYNIAQQATLIGCNGVNSGSTWGEFGGDTATGDKYDALYNISLIGCNVENYKVDGILTKHGGSLTINNTTFLTKQTYNSTIHTTGISASNLYVTQSNISPAFSGLTQLRDIYTESKLFLTSYSGDFEAVDSLSNIQKFYGVSTTVTRTGYENYLGITKLQSDTISVTNNITATSFSGATEHCIFLDDTLQSTTSTTDVLVKSFKFSTFDMYKHLNTVISLYSGDASATATLTIKTNNAYAQVISTTNTAETYFNIGNHIYPNQTTLQPVEVEVYLNTSNASYAANTKFIQVNVQG